MSAKNIPGDKQRLTHLTAESSDANKRMGQTLIDHRCPFAPVEANCVIDG
ncbi:hypothetical protein KGM_205981 [Danaus plexippus plexippus]|uniref:Uncharacterized protein n=1 Tax=Danaus plexippus plexippus TaxID=278856 RepID=A0A212EH63_DANPL|nr:hypothetical protein KGM_205981 [Danaus plexippus plexippus]